MQPKLPVFFAFEHLTIQPVIAHVPETGDYLHLSRMYKHHFVEKVHSKEGRGSPGGLPKLK